MAASLLIMVCIPPPLQVQSLWAAHLATRQQSKRSSSTSMALSPPPHLSMKAVRAAWRLVQPLLLDLSYVMAVAGGGGAGRAREGVAAAGQLPSIANRVSLVAIRVLAHLISAGMHHAATCILDACRELGWP